MGTQHRVTVAQEITCDYACAACKTLAIATYHAKGNGGWVPEGFDGGAEAHRLSARSAARDLTDDAARVLRLIRCPVCNQRSKNALRYTALLAVGSILGALAAAVVIDDAVAKLCAAGGIFALGMSALFADLGRIFRARRAVLTVTSRGKGARRVSAPPRRAAPVAPVAPAAPIRTVAPELAEPRGPDEAPSFLKT